MKYLKRFNENYEFDDYTHADAELVKELYDDGLTDPRQLSIETDLDLDVIHQILSNMGINEMWTQTTTKPKEEIDLQFVSKDKTYYGVHNIDVSYKNKRTKVKAKFDTGARSSSIDFSVAKRLGISDELIEKCKKLDDIFIPKDATKKEQVELERKYTNELKLEFPEITSVQGSRSSSGFSIRAYVNMNVEYHGKVINTEVNLRDRTGLSCEMLVGLKDML